MTTDTEDEGMSLGFIIFLCCGGFIIVGVGIVLSLWIEGDL